jgi:hypothetical protein
MKMLLDRLGLCLLPSQRLRKGTGAFWLTLTTLFNITNTKEDITMKDLENDRRQIDRQLTKEERELIITQAVAKAIESDLRLYSDMQMINNKQSNLAEAQALLDKRMVEYVERIPELPKESRVLVETCAQGCCLVLKFNEALKTFTDPVVRRSHEEALRDLTPEGINDTLH